MVDNGCSYDYSTVAQCLNQKIGIIPSEFKYYIDPLFSGPQSHDYCAFKIPQINNNMYTQSTQYQGIIFGANVRCVEVKYGENIMDIVLNVNVFNGMKYINILMVLKLLLMMGQLVMKK